MSRLLHMQPSARNEGQGSGKGQLDLLQPGEINAEIKGGHAEKKVLQAAADQRLKPQALGVTRDICPSCRAKIESSGGIVSPDKRTAIRPQNAP